MNKTIKKLCSIRGALCLFCLLFVTTMNAYAGYVDKNLSSGKVRVHIPDNLPNQCDVVLLGVGTAMKSESYDKLSAQINKFGYVVGILDHAPGDTFKTDAGKFARLAKAVKYKMRSWLADTNGSSVAHWIMGGHSAGGQAAPNAVAEDVNLADAIFSIDPYNMNDTQDVYVPALYWGFAETTCFVEVNDAAKKGYYKTHAQRAFVKVAKKYSWGPCGYSPEFHHCSFCDDHCPVCTNCKHTPDFFFKDVAKSVNKFIKAAFYGNWSKNALSFRSKTPLTLYVDADQP